jgi:MipA family protein
VRPSSRVLRRLVTLLLAGATLLTPALAPADAQAQSPNPTPKPATPSQVVMGVGVWSRPAYVGSDARILSVVPIIRYYGRPWFARTTQGMLEGGARMTIARGVTVGAQVAYEVGRDTKDSESLASRDVATLPVSGSIGVHAGWDTELGPAPVNLVLRYRHDAESSRGAQADLRATIGILGGSHLRLGVFAQGTWADAKSNQAFYGISPSESAVTGLPSYESAAGMVYVSAGLPWSYEIGTTWMLQGNFEMRQLSSELRNSPLTQVRTNAYVAAGLAYRF